MASKCCCTRAQRMPGGCLLPFGSGLRRRSCLRRSSPGYLNHGPCSNRRPPLPRPPAATAGVFGRQVHRVVHQRRRPGEPEVSLQRRSVAKLPVLLIVTFRRAASTSSSLPITARPSISASSPCSALTTRYPRLPYGRVQIDAAFMRRLRADRHRSSSKPAPVLRDIPRSLFTKVRRSVWSLDPSPICAPCGRGRVYSSGMPALPRPTK
jgi:hypothetical protein